MQCADIRFNASAALLDDNVCKNDTGVGGVALGAATTVTTTAAAPSATGAAAALRPGSSWGVLGAMLVGGLVVGGL